MPSTVTLKRTGLPSAPATSALLGSKRTSPSTRCGSAADSRCITDQLTATDLPQATRDLLAEIQMPKPIRAVYNRDYQPLEKLALESYVVHSAP